LWNLRRRYVIPQWGKGSVRELGCLLCYQEPTGIRRSRWPSQRGYSVAVKVKRSKDSVGGTGKSREVGKNQKREVVQNREAERGTFAQAAVLTPMSVSRVLKGLGNSLLAVRQIFGLDTSTKSNADQSKTKLPQAACECGREWTRDWMSKSSGEYETGRRTLPVK